MRIPDDDKPLFENLDDQRRRLYDDFNAMVQQIREGTVGDDDRMRLLSQQLHTKHIAVIERMIDLLRYY